jgi:hypothetical protein
MVNAVSVMTIVVPDPAQAPGVTGPAVSRNGTVPARSPDPRAALGEPVSEVHDERELGHLGRMAGSG